MDDLQPAINLIKFSEACKLNAYWDRWGKVWTIGWGSTAGVIEGDVVTEAEAEKMLMHDLTGYRVPSLKRMVTVPITNNQLCALIDFCYNEGNTKFHNSTLRRLLNEGQSKDVVAAQFLRWDEAGGVILPGLLTRRKAEQALFLA